MLKLLQWLLAGVLHLLYRVEVQGVFPKNPPYILAPNHVSFVDWLVVGALCPEIPHYLMWRPYYEKAPWLFRHLPVIPLSPAHLTPIGAAGGLSQAEHVLRQAGVVVIFPEGAITTTGDLGPLRPGVLRMSQETWAPIVPVHLEGLWGSLWSRDPQRRGTWRRKITVTVGLPLYPVSLAHLRDRMLLLRETS